MQLDKVDATVGAPVGQEQVSELPINGRDWATDCAGTGALSTMEPAISGPFGLRATVWTTTI